MNYIPLILAAILLVYTAYRRLTRISISEVQGPEPETFLLGNMPELLRSQAGEADFKWHEMYGDVVRVKASLGEDRLLISDPKALYHIFQAGGGYRFPKQPVRRALTYLLVGKGITWAEGDWVMTTGDIKDLCRPVLERLKQGHWFLYSSRMRICTIIKVTVKWRNILIEGEWAVFDVPHWISRATLDAIGGAAFDYRFGAMENDDNPLAAAYKNLMNDTFGSISNGAILAQDLSQHIPHCILEFMVDYFPSARLTHARHIGKLTRSVAKELVALKTQALLEGDSTRRDIMSLLVKANASDSENHKFTEIELLSQMQVLIFAGHETTANTLSWTLLELCRNPEIQRKLRSEIRAMAQVIRDRGDEAFSAADFEKMNFLTAVVKVESLRFHPVSYHLPRQSGQDDLLPLSKPITLTSGKVITELPIPKGLKIIGSIAGYNRNKDIFGDDAHIYKPERWLSNSQEKTGVSLGVYANLFTFSAGNKACLGWRFAILELQAFLVELIDNFEFALTPEAERIRREVCSIIMTPTVAGQVEKGTQLPLKVRMASRN